MKRTGERPSRSGASNVDIKERSLPKRVCHAQKEFPAAVLLARKGMFTDCTDADSYDLPPAALADMLRADVGTELRGSMESTKHLPKTGKYEVTKAPRGTSMEGIYHA
jgi:hypothetical protein